MQHGFRRKFSCETQLIEFIDDVTKNIDNGQQTDCLIMDFSKAFDKVSHSLLVHKLQHYGIRGKTNRWIKSFLSGRTQCVLVEGEKSSSIDVASGVPQQHAHRFFHLGGTCTLYLHFWGYIKIFGGAMYPLTLHLGVQRK